MLSPIERARAASELAQLAGALKAKTLPLREGLKASARAIALVDLLTGKSAPASISKAPVPFAAFVPQKDGSLVAAGAQETPDEQPVQVNEHGNEYRMMAAPKTLYRAVSPEEFEQIKRTGAITGGLNRFNPFDPRREVFFGDTMSARLIWQGEDVTRRAEYEVQGSELGAKAKQLRDDLERVGEKIKALLGGRLKDAMPARRADDPEYAALLKQDTELSAELEAVRTKARAAMNEAVTRKRQADDERGYSSVVLETKPISGGRVYTGKHSGMGDEAEYGFDAGAVKLSDVVRFHYVKGKQVIRTEEAGKGGRAPAGGTIGMNGEFYPGGAFLPNTALPKRGSATAGSGAGEVLIEPGVRAAPPAEGMHSLFMAFREFMGVDGGKAVATPRPDVAVKAYVHEDVALGRRMIQVAIDAYNGGKRWVMPGEIERLAREVAAGAPETPPASDSTPTEGVAIGDALQGVQAAPEPASLELTEYTTKRGKVLRGVVRHDLTYAEAKAIDPHTWRMKGAGGYFIREKYLTGDIPVSDKPAQPAVQALTPEQEAERERARIEQAERQQAERKAAQVAKLREVAQATIDKAEEDLGRARLTNTARRANMAAGIAARNEKAVALGKTMLRIADAVEAGAAPRLAGVDSRATVETLQQAMANARYKAVTHETANASYQERENARHRAVRLEDLQHVEYPTARWGQDGAYNSRAKALDAIKGKRGAPALADRIRYAREIDAETYRALVKMLGKKEANSLVGWHAEEQIARAERLRRAGIPDRETLVEALRELYDLREDARKEDPVKAAERAIIGQKVGIDFFPTPAHVAQRMARLAKIGQGTRVLEPSAGNGNLADAAKAEGAEVDVCEISSQLREILTLKGFNVVDHDFMTYTPEQPYEAIIMNPPFSKRQDAEHIRRAFGMLAPGGRLVAIAGEGVFFGQDAKAVAFREWLEQHGAEVEKLDGGTFNDTSLLAQTGANARLIIIRK